MKLVTGGRVDSLATHLCVIRSQTSTNLDIDGLVRPAPTSGASRRPTKWSQQIDAGVADARDNYASTWSAQVGSKFMGGFGEPPVHTHADASAEIRPRAWAFEPADLDADAASGATGATSSIALAGDDYVDAMMVSASQFNYMHQQLVAPGWRRSPAGPFAHRPKCSSMCKTDSSNQNEIRRIAATQLAR